uniref:Adf1_4 protein n=1 Tax=Fopius arisanus TaxID=64838 RepID=A0A0C9RJR9_9HYME
MRSKSLLFKTTNQRVCRVVLNENACKGYVLSKMGDHDQYFNNNRLDDNETEFENDGNFKENDELLIDAVRAYPHLYSHQDRNFQDAMMKENSWKEISIAVNIPDTECKTRWIRLQERFGKEKRQRESDARSGSGASRRSVFVY